MVFTLALLAYLVIGSLAGIIAGLLGLGGGVVTVPCLLIVFSLLKFQESYLMHMAIATSLAAMIFNTFSATWAHNKRKAVLWKIVFKMAPGFVLGSCLGVFLASSLSDPVLENFFGVFLCILGVYFLFKKERIQGNYQLPKTPLLWLLSSGIGAISNLLGIGGGAMTVPLLVHFNVDEKRAIGTSSCTSFLLTAIGAISYLFLGLGKTTTTDTLGFINLPACLIIGLTSFLTAPFGTKLAHELPIARIRKIFAVVVIFTGLSMFFH